MLDSSAFGRLGGEAEVQVVQHKPSLVLGAPWRCPAWAAGGTCGPCEGLAVVVSHRCPLLNAILGVQVVDGLVCG